MDLRVRAALLCAINISMLAAGGVTYAVRHPLHPVIRVVPLGEVPPEDIADVVMQLRERLGVPVIVSAAAPIAAGAFVAFAGAYDANVILDALGDIDAWKVVAVTSEPIFMHADDEIRPVAGAAHHNGRGALLTTATFDAHFSHPLARSRRVEVLALHELGHALGLGHCPVAGCVMRESQGSAVAWADLVSGDWCLRCRLKLDEGVVRPAAEVVAWSVDAPWAQGQARHP